MWNKRPFESYLCKSLRDAPFCSAVCHSVNRTGRCRLLVDRLVEDEAKYQRVTLLLVLEIASMTSFPNIEQIKDSEDREYRLAEAQQAVKRLGKLTSEYGQALSGRERVAADEEARRAQTEAQRRFADEVEALRVRFLELQMDDSDPSRRGKALEVLLADFFALLIWSLVWPMT